MSADQIADVLAKHWSASTHTDQTPTVDKCDGCGEVILEWGGKGDSWDIDPRNLLAAHLAAVLVPIIEAREQEAARVALLDAAEELDCDIYDAYDAINWLRARAGNRA